MDLLSVVTHELGHVLDYDHDQSSGVMAATLEAGVRTVGTWAPAWETPLAAWNGYSANLHATRSVFAERFPLAGDESWLWTLDSRWTPSRTSQATRVRDQLFESLGLDEAQADLLESRPKRTDHHVYRVGTLEELSELTASAFAAEASREVEEFELDAELLDAILAAR